MSSAVATRAAFAQTTGDRVGTAVIGTGGRGSHLLAGVLEQPNAKVVAVCDNKPDRLDKAATAAARDNPSTTTDWRKIIDNKDVEAVFVATPPDLHSEMAVAALKAGKHVYCEKPIGITPAQVRDLVRAARASKKVFTSGQQLRSIKRYQESVKKLREGAIGDIVMIKAQRHAWGDLSHDGSSADWYFDVTKSGGYLIEQSVHNLDLCNWIIGQRPSRAVGFGGINFYKNQPPGRTIMDHGSMTFEYPNGIRMAFTQNVFHPRMMPCGGQFIHVYGSQGAVDFMGTGNVYSLDPNITAPGQPFVPKQEESEHAHITAFYEAIQKGTPSPADVVVGATAALTAILGHEAMVRQKVVTWNDLGVDL